MALAFSVFNAVAAVLALAILGLAIPLPKYVGTSAGSAAWSNGAMLALAVCLVVTVKFPRFSALVLLFACAFFFLSCSANFRWAGG